MLRRLFGEQRRTDGGLVLEVRQQIEAYLSLIHQREQANRLTEQQVQRLSIWSKGFLVALDELEQSLYCSRKYAELLRTPYEDKMDPEEHDDYHRHLYFYKNGMIRVFSILDKLGVFLDDRLQLQTNTVKLRFSYFTVLRQMYESHTERELQKRLYDTKLKFKEPMNRLRSQRNMEIHAMNAELLDDMQHAESSGISSVHIEDYRQNNEDLEKGFEMVCQTLSSVFSHMSQHTIL